MKLLTTLFCLLAIPVVIGSLIKVVVLVRGERSEAPQVHVNRDPSGEVDAGALAVPNGARVDLGSGASDSVVSGDGYITQSLDENSFRFEGCVHDYDIVVAPWCRIEVHCADGGVSRVTPINCTP